MAWFLCLFFSLPPKSSLLEGRRGREGARGRAHRRIVFADKNDQVSPATSTSRLQGTAARDGYCGGRHLNWPLTCLRSWLLSRGRLGRGGGRVVDGGSQGGVVLKADRLTRKWPREWGGVAGENVMEDLAQSLRGGLKTPTGPAKSDLGPRRAPLVHGRRRLRRRRLFVGGWLRKRLRWGRRRGLRLLGELALRGWRVEEAEVQRLGPVEAADPVAAQVEEPQPGERQQKERRRVQVVARREELLQKRVARPCGTGAGPGFARTEVNRFYIKRERYIK